ncbi:Uma2 family endonuclease [Haliscomenobacter sp.]|uniref:Uma2 family endonuclease n=1 Tax=Haliscomenobacter sp. TaxID=2717303 RepID=UPI003593CB72
MASLVTTPITSLSQLDPEGVYTYADYLTWQIKERVELIRGRLFPMSPAPNTFHQQIAGALNFRLYGHFLGKSCQVFSAPFDVRLPVSLKKGQTTTVVQPDLCVICDPGKLDNQGCDGAPDLIIEILSPGNSQKEMREKYQVYEESGVREYWLVYPLDREVRVYVLNEAGKYIGLAPVLEDEVLRSAVFPELEVDLGMVFGG